MTVRTEDTLLDPHQTTTVHRIGAELLQQRTTALPGRSLPELVNTQPGWLLEANGILHPRGSEYQTQYVVDGLPLTDNRSPAFAPAIDADEVQSLSILTGGYPAEYGRKLGGVIEVATAGHARRGLHGSVGGSVGSFSTHSGDAIGEYGWPRTTLSVSGGVASTDRFLDPPVEQNYTNRGTTSQLALHLEHDITDGDRFGVIVRHGQVRFTVPNEQIQQQAGQRQDRDSRETVGQFSYQRVMSDAWLAELRGMARTLDAGLWSNAAAIPIVAQQDRGIRELYVKGTLAAHAGRHEWKAGGDVSSGTVHESFGYVLTDLSQFNPNTPATFAFADRRADREQALFVQDQIRLGAWTVNGGLRWDHYRLVVEESAISPRLGVAWASPAAGVAVRASCTIARFRRRPLKTSSWRARRRLMRWTIRSSASRCGHRCGNFFDVGVSKTLGGTARLDATWFDRRMNDFADDDLLLNTGVSFPIAFDRADIHGTEITLSAPHWNRFAGSLTYAYMRGVGELPVTGGLFLGDRSTTLLRSTDQFPVSQDQRHTVVGRASYRMTPSAWLALAGAYGSGLPFEFDGDTQDAVAQYGQRIIDRVDFATGRVRPSFSIDASLGIVVLKTERHSLRLQADLRNLTDRLNVINFAGLFSGTALAAPRSLAFRARADF